MLDAATQAPAAAPPAASALPTPAPPAAPAATTPAPPAATTPDARGLRWHLGVVVLAALLPALTLGGASLWEAAYSQARMVESRLTVTARTIAGAVARDIDTLRAITRALADLPEADDADLAEFRTVATRLAAPLPGWVVLTDAATGHQLVNTRLPAGSPLPAYPTAAASRAATERTGQLVVSELFVSRGLQREIVALTAPVPLQGRVARTVALGFEPARLVPLLQIGGASEPGIVTLMDANGRVVARSHDHARFLGGTAPYWQEHHAQASVLLRAVNLEGQDSLVAIEPVPGLPGWTVAVGAPWERFATPHNAAFLVPAAGMAAAIAVALGLVLWLARRLLGPVEALARESTAPAGAATAAVALSGIREIDTLASAMREARDALAARAEEAERQAALLASITDATDELVFAKDLDLRFVMVNQALAESFGLPADQVIGRRSRELLPGRDAAMIEAHDQLVLRTGTTQKYNLDISVPRSGLLRSYTTVKAPWRDREGSIIGFVAVSRDVTDARATETRLAAAQTRLLQVSRLGTTGAVAAGLAHELNQPLTSVTNYTSAALRLLGAAGQPAPPPEQIEQVRAALPAATAEARRAGAILARLRDGLVGGATDRRPEPLDEVLRDAAAIAAPMLRRISAELRLDLPERLGTAEIDRIQIQQVLLNLLRNAAEALETCRERRVRLSARRAPGAGGFVIEVADSGPGVAAEIAGQLFQPFVGTKPEGLGVGLAICHSVVEAHGGTITAAVAPEGGALFRIRLPDAGHA